MAEILSRFSNLSDVEAFLFALSVSASQILAILTGILTLVLLIRKLIDRWWNRLEREKTPSLEGRARLYLESGNEDHRTRLLKTRFGERTILKSILLDLAEREDLDQAKRLTDLYRELGWVKKDKAVLKSSLFWWKRAAAAHRLGQFGVRDAQDPLRRALDDPNIEVRLEATWALGHMGFVEDLPRIVSSMSEFFKIAALRMDAFIFDMGKPALPVLHDLCRNGEFEVRLLAIHLVGEFKDPQSLSLLIPLLDSDNLEIKMAACKAIGSIGDSKGLTVLKPYLKDEAWQLRAQVAKQFGRNQFKEAASAVAEGLKDQAWWVRFNSGEALSRFGSQGKIALETASQSPDQFAREMAAQWLDELEASAA